MNTLIVENLDNQVKALRQALISHGYTKSTIRSYTFYIKDFLGWLGARRSGDGGATPPPISNPFPSIDTNAAPDGSPNPPLTTNHKRPAPHLYHSMVAYGVYLKEERKVAPSSVSQAMAAVSFFLRHVVDGASRVAIIGGCEERSTGVDAIAPDQFSSSPREGSPDLTIIRSMLGPEYDERKPNVPYEMVRKIKK